MKKKFLFGLIAYVGLLPMQAQTFSISEFTIPAGGVADVDICLNCEANKWGAFQFDLVLPTGITVVEDEYGFYYEYTDRLTYMSSRVTKYFNVSDKLQSDESRYRVIIDNSDTKTITGTSGPLLGIQLKAEDFLDTDYVTVGIANIVCTGPTGDGTVYPADIAEAGRGLVRMDVTVGSTGWATFSWPRSCDFTGVDVEAYIGTQMNDGSIHLERVYNVRQNTGILLHGEPGTYHPSVGANLGHEYDDTSANLFGQTASATFQTDATNYYVLATHDGNTGFYPARQGLTIPKYRAYLQVETGGAAPSFVWLDGVETAIQPIVTSQSSNEIWYRLDGMRVEKPTQPGIYVKQGKKIKL
ncbi:MAG: hypothetical protein K5945_10565 [Bacteroidaceae bacterium]|nr:hypothetical protein [Bacteroidaceae bacterium]